MKEAEADLSGRVIGAAIRVHEALGPGFLESVCEEALCLELAAQRIGFERQRSVQIRYREKPVGEHRLDLLIENQLVVGLKAISTFEASHYAVVRSYLKAVDCALGLLINFAPPTVQVKRVGREWHSKVL